MTPLCLVLFILIECIALELHLRSNVTLSTTIAVIFMVSGFWLPVIT